MSSLYDKQADFYVEARPTYPTEWYSMLAALTPHHSLAWDVVEHYDHVVGTDVSEAQLKLAMPHPCVRYLHTPLSMPYDELVDLIRGENSVNLVTLAMAIHWFELPKFYSIVTCSKKARWLNTAKDQGVDLLPESVVKVFESAWGAPTLVRLVIFKHLSTYGIMNGYVNACSWHRSKKQA
ncbi:hypothetical protein SO802_021688 [Lithocarpus litseifolius]|uniref:Uncharacterized protein n=1 Tax=Lithocarpus litseifolius TaxID=425828 RepID=A0AAW2CFU5_9ROSI